MPGAFFNVSLSLFWNCLYVRDSPLCDKAKRCWPLLPGTKLNRFKIAFTGHSTEPGKIGRGKVSNSLPNWWFFAHLIPTTTLFLVKIRSPRVSCLSALNPIWVSGNKFDFLNNKKKAIEQAHQKTASSTLEWLSCEWMCFSSPGVIGWALLVMCWQSRLKPINVNLSKYPWNPAKLNFVISCSFFNTTQVGNYWRMRVQTSRQELRVPR